MTSEVKKRMRQQDWALLFGLGLGIGLLFTEIGMEPVIMGLFFGCFAVPVFNALADEPQKIKRTNAAPAAWAWSYRIIMAALPVFAMLIARRLEWPVGVAGVGCLTATLAAAVMAWDLRRRFPIRD